MKLYTTQDVQIALYVCLFLHDYVYCTVGRLYRDSMDTQCMTIQKISKSQKYKTNKLL